jgi:hypothetical protein
MIDSADLEHITSHNQPRFGIDDFAIIVFHWVGSHDVFPVTADGR